MGAACYAISFVQNEVNIYIMAMLWANQHFLYRSTNRNENSKFCLRGSNFNWGFNFQRPSHRIMSKFSLI